jgi:hypothetical protein
VMDTKDYESKVEEHLRGEEYQQIPTDTTPKLEIQLRNMTKGIEELREVVPAARTAGQPNNRSSKFYALPKVHKEGIPMRPIVDSKETVFHPLAKFLAALLRPLTTSSQISINNAFAFIPKIESFKSANELAMCSFDVKSLFTSVPRNDTLKIVEERLKNDPTLIDRTALTPKFICELVRFCIESTIFQYKDKFYVQKSGLAMGSPLSPVLAEIFMQDLEEKCIANFQGEKPNLICRYVDDYFLLYNPIKLKIENFLSHFNSAHPNISFTMEKEAEKALPFLDILIKKSEENFFLSVYRKPTNTNSTLHFDSNHSYSTKFTVALSMFKRAYAYCKLERERKDEINKIYSILLQHNYPKKFIHKAHNRVKNPAAAQPEEAQAFGQTIVIPYVKNLSEQIRAISQKTARVRTAFSVSGTLRGSLMPNKTKSKPVLTNLLYKIPCADCNSLYIGQTKRNVAERFSEHARNFNKQNVNLNSAKDDNTFSKLAYHAKSKDHKIDWQNSKVILFENRFRKRVAAEAMAMVTFAKETNVISQPSLQISPLFFPFIHSEKNYFKDKCAVPTAGIKAVQKAEKIAAETPAAAAAAAPASASGANSPKPSAVTESARSERIRRASTPPHPPPAHNYFFRCRPAATARP